IAILLKAILSAVVGGVIFFGWFLATVNSPPRHRPAHGPWQDFAVYLLAGVLSSTAADGLFWHQGVPRHLIEHAVPIANLALVFTVRNQIRRMRSASQELMA
ncbi:MAG: hypothetical protein AAGI15_02550, partial [Pseudomonadota bacterium]